MEKEAFNKSKRIASNTIFLFIRMFVLTLVNLYAVRIIFKELGEQDYGIFNTVASIVLLTSFINSTLSLSIQRFFSIALGRNEEESLRRIFSASLNIILILSLLSLILLCTIGAWFFCTHLVIPAERFTAASWCYVFTIGSFICTILQIPFMGALFAHEDIGHYAVISTAECFLKLLAAYLIAFFSYDHLITYSFLLWTVSVIILLSYIIISHHKYAECHYILTTDRKLHQKLLSFSGWTLLGPVASVGAIQGNTILLNTFFGPVIIASFAIALQINNAFNTLCNSVVLAFRPAMIKAYAEEKIQFLNQLFSVINKFLAILFLAIALPLIIEMRTIIGLWLDDCSETSILFARLIIIYVFILTLNNPITIILEASGHVKEYHLPVEIIMFMCFPLSWFMLSCGLPADSVLWTMIGVCLIAHLERVVILQKYHHSFSMREYLISFCLPVAVIGGISSLVALAIHHSIDVIWIRFLAIIIATPSIIFILGYLIGINQKEKTIVNELLYKPILKALPWKQA